MNIGIVAVAWNGYGKYLVEFCEFIAKSSILPTCVTIVLGKDHGASRSDILRAIEYLPGRLSIISNEDEDPTVGSLTNFAIEWTDTEWIMPMDIDDLLLPNAIEGMQLFADNSDYICIAWRVMHRGKMLYRSSPTPGQLTHMSASQRSRRRINNNSPFRRAFWLAQDDNGKFGFENTDYYNLEFLARLVRLQARFAQLRRPCITWRQTRNSMHLTWTDQDRKAAAESARKMYQVFENNYLW